MSKQNKITSYFVNSISKQKPETKLSIKLKEKDFNFDDECYILDKIDNSKNTNIDINKTSISPKKNCDLNNDLNSQHIENESLTKVNEMENDTDDHDLVNSLIDYESKNNDDTEKNGIKHIDDTTIFFLNMLEDFLNKPFLHYLFESCDIALLNTFFNLPAIDHKLLFIRMYWLQCKWYKTSDVVKKYLKYDFDKNKWSKQVVKDLIDSKFLLNGDECMNFNDWTKVLLRPDLLQICNYFKINTVKADKNLLINRLEKFSSTKSTILNITLGNSKSMEKIVLDKINKLFGSCVKICDKVRSIFDCLHIISYLGMNPAIIREKRLNLLLMNIKNGQQTFPQVSSEYDSPECVFPTKEHFIEYVYSYKLYEDQFKLLTTTPCDHNAVIDICRNTVNRYNNLRKDNTINEIPPVWLHSFTPAYRYIKIMEKAINSYKALKDLEYLNEAISILDTLLDQTEYRQSSRALWYSEKALIMHTKLKNFHQTADILFKALNDSALTEDAKAPLMERGKRLALQKSAKLSTEMSTFFLNFKFESEGNFPFIEISAKSTNDNCPGKKARYVFRDIISGDSTYSNVEQYALLHYINNTDFNSGEHWEGRIICSIFVLLFWDIIYSPVESKKGIFLSPYQEAPLDLYTTSFYDNRKDKIDVRLIEIESGWPSMDHIIEYMQNIFTCRKTGELSILHNIEWAYVAEISQCLGRNGLFCICKRLSSMYQYAHSGFPDLTIWNIKTKKVKFVEVKGDGDKLSCKQIQWMSYLLKNGIETEVCYVHKGANRKSPKKNAKVSPKKNLQINDDKMEDDFKVKTKVPLKKTKRKQKNADKIIKIEESEIEVQHPRANVTNTPKSSPSKTKVKLESPNKIISSQPTECYLRSPSKSSKGGVGFFVSPKKEFTSPTKSPNAKSRKRASLSLTRRRIFESDT